MVHISCFLEWSYATIYANSSSSTLFWPRKKEYQISDGIYLFTFSPSRMKFIFVTRCAGKKLYFLFFIFFIFWPWRPQNIRFREYSISLFHLNSSPLCLCNGSNALHQNCQRIAAKYHRRHNGIAIVYYTPICIH